MTTVVWRMFMSLVDQLCRFVGIKQFDEKALFNRIREACSPDGKLLFIGDVLKRANNLFPNRIALEAVDHAVTYAQLYAMTQ